MYARGQDNTDLMSQLGIQPNSLLKNAKSLGLSGKGQLPLDGGIKSVTDAAVSDSLYRVGPGDVFGIYLGEARQVPVNAEGFLQLPDLAPVKVSGLTLRAAKGLIKASLRKSYDTSKVYVTLAGAKSFKVHVLGEVMYPGAKVITGSARVDEVILQSGGFSNSAVRDRVWVILPSGDTSEIRLERFFESYADSDNPHLNIGDKIVVKSIDPAEPIAVVRINNNVYFQKISGDFNLKRVFNQIGAYSVNEFPAHARVIHSGGKLENLQLSEAASYVPVAGDTIELLRESDAVFVGGAVARPSLYPYIPQFSVSDYLYQAGLLPISQHESNAQVTRGDKHLSLREVSETGIKPGDKIKIDRSSMEETRDYLSIVASLAGIVLSAATLYYTFSRTN